MKSILQYMGWRRIAFEALQRDGVVVMPPLAEEQIQSIRDHLDKGGAIINAPVFFELCISMFDLATNYFKKPAHLLSLVSELIPADGQSTKWQPWGQPCGEIVILVYGTPVLVSGCGAFIYQSATHRTLAEQAKPETIIGPAGTVILYDPAGYHMGLRPSQDQWVLRGVWGAQLAGVRNLNAPAASKTLLGNRYPHTKALREAISNVVRNEHD